ncbi:polysaccharide biosynthesis C-terminal domain-containing protein [Candidatus Micrarchaeota archaeon]|nr:polysaccharide biosynthesis C-terminal domain-containing protein [Candidatus Micrarchaeota archaeon]
MAEETEGFKVAKKIGIGSIANFISVGIGKVFTLLFYLLIFWALSKEDAGLFFIALSFMGVISMSFNFGVPAIMQRYTAFFEGQGKHGKLKDLFLKGIVFTVVSAFVVSFFLYLFRETIVNFYGNVHLLELMGLVVLGSFFTIVYPYFIQFLLGRQRFIRYASINSVYPFSRIIFALIFIFVLFDSTVVSMLLAHTMSLAFAFLLSMILCIYDFFKFIYPNKRQSLTFLEIKEMIFYGVPVYVTSISSTITSHADTLCIGYFMPEEAVASYNSVLTIARNAGYIVSTIFSNIMGSTLSYYYGKGNMDMFKKITENSLKWYLFFGLPVLLVVLVYPFEIMKYFFNDYADSYWLFYILGPTFFMMVLSTSHKTALSAGGKTKVFTYVTLAMIIPNLILNIILIPHLGLLGAAIATMFSFISSKSLFIYYSKKYFGIWFPKDIHKVLLSGGIMLFCLILIHQFVDIELVTASIFDTMSFDIPVRIISIFVLGLIVGSVFLIYTASFFIQKPFTDVEKRLLNKYILQNFSFLID